MARIKVEASGELKHLAHRRTHRWVATPFPGFTCGNPPTDAERAAMKERLDHEKRVEKEEV